MSTRKTFKTFTLCTNLFCTDRPLINHIEAGISVEKRGDNPKNHASYILGRHAMEIPLHANVCQAIAASGNEKKLNQVSLGKNKGHVLGYNTVEGAPVHALVHVMYVHQHNGPKLWPNNNVLMHLDEWHILMTLEPGEVVYFGENEETAIIFDGENIKYDWSKNIVDPARHNPAEKPDEWL